MDGLIVWAVLIVCAVVLRKLLRWGWQYLDEKLPSTPQKKLAFGGWMLNAAFPVLARFKGLRGTPLDIFGKTEERRMERRRDHRG